MIRTSTFSSTRMSFLFYCIAFFSVLQTVTAQAPGGISGNLRLWLKANSNVTPSTQGGNVTNWASQTGSGADAVYTTPMFSQTVRSFCP